MNLACSFFIRCFKNLAFNCDKKVLLYKVQNNIVRQKGLSCGKVGLNVGKGRYIPVRPVGITTY